MNRIRRKAVENVLLKLKAVEDLLNECREEIETIRDDEQDALEAMPDSLQESPKGETMQEYIEFAEDAIEILEAADIDSAIFDMAQLVAQR